MTRRNSLLYGKIAVIRLEMVGMVAVVTASIQISDEIEDEDAHDLQALRQAIKEDDGARYSLDDVARELEIRVYDAGK